MHRISARARLGTCAVLAAAALGAVPATSEAHHTTYCGHAQSIKAFWWTLYTGHTNEAFASAKNIVFYYHYHFTDHWYSSLGALGLHKYKHSQKGYCGVKQRVGTLIGNPDDPPPSGPELGDVQPVWVDVGEPDTTASAATAPRIDYAQPVEALDVLNAAGYDTKVAEVTPTTGPDGQPGYVYTDVPEGSPPPAGDCVVSVLTRDFEAVDPAAPPNELSMEVADRATADALGHGC